MVRDIYLLNKIDRYIYLVNKIDSFIYLDNKINMTFWRKIAGLELSLVQSFWSNILNTISDGLGWTSTQGCGFIEISRAVVAVKASVLWIN